MCYAACTACRLIGWSECALPIIVACSSFLLAGQSVYAVSVVVQISSFLGYCGYTYIIGAEAKFT